MKKQLAVETLTPKQAGALALLAVADVRMGTGIKVRNQLGTQQGALMQEMDDVEMEEFIAICKTLWAIEDFAGLAVRA